VAESRLHVIFDVDGTLVDSNDAHAQAWVDALAETGRTVPFERVRGLIGKGGDKVLPELTGLSDDSPEGERISARRKDLFKTRFLPGLRPLNGARDLVAHLASRGHPLGIATSAQPEELDPLLATAGVGEFFVHRTSSGDAQRSKPDPDIVRAALARMQVDAGAAVMIGDTPYDVAAAARAGVRTIALRSGGWADEDLAGAAEIYDDCAHLLREYERSILASA
jgi:HAD superfamily hydrolase (TIGR01509 family)